ncbi:hypothetical protein VC83_04912 [Pseudogymnoascus destructans]|uniref:Amidase domain-containing protein n=2 Tax=Pseudogymnoascus destructans TaxID=655981 RepID=L8G218_PSED2|nr:uncharacterized protein VC83_04912 [Pseudogymnoascus destructans]ELR06854.1 hypothetical protein GMDG_08145 [Pseudogymnoascus destructans 20631-21]OAF58673.1 hypothetical protein VC83_04912 [Pseudogymnoascus destructans]
MMLFRALLMLSLLVLGVLGLRVPRSPDKKVNDTFPDLLDAGTDDLMKGLKQKHFTSVDLVKAYLKRIQEVQPQLHAVTEINPDAISIAQTLDAERAQGKLRSALHGLPMLVKDNIATNDKMNNSAGSFALLGAKVPRDSTVVAKLKAAGVIILGKSSMSEWANFRSGSGNACNGWSAYGGQVLGAYATGQDPSGSSSGSAVGASLGLAFATLGTETGGSIISPGSVNNAVGIKPTVGLTSRSLVIPISERQDTIGPLARTVTDAAHVLNIIAGKDPSDSYTNAQPFSQPPNYTKSLKKNSLKGKRIGIPRNAFLPTGDSNFDAPIMAAFEAAIMELKAAGATIIDNANFSQWEEYYNSSVTSYGAVKTVVAVDFITNLPQYFTQLTTNPNNITSLRALRDFTQHDPRENFPTRNTDIFDAALTITGDNTAPGFQALANQTHAWGTSGGVTGALDTYRLDALVMPSMYAPWVPALAGLPIVTVPMGKYPAGTQVQRLGACGLVAVAPNVPIGLSFLGAAWSEEALIGCAFAYEQRTLVREKVRPIVVPRTQLEDVVDQ